MWLQLDNAKVPGLYRVKYRRQSLQEGLLTKNTNVMPDADVEDNRLVRGRTAFRELVLTPMYLT